MALSPSRTGPSFVRIARDSPGITVLGTSDEHEIATESSQSFMLPCIPQRFERRAVTKQTATDQLYPGYLSVTTVFPATSGQLLAGMVNISSVCWSSGATWTGLDCKCAPGPILFAVAYLQVTSALTS